MIVLTHEDANANLEGIVLAKHNESPLKTNQEREDAAETKRMLVWLNVTPCIKMQHVAGKMNTLM